MANLNIALLLPGQGAQHVGMGRDLAERYKHVRDLYEAADELLGVGLTQICWEGPEEELTRTENAQPAILLHSHAVWTCLPDHVRARVRVAAGHSLGEFTAHLAGGTFGLESALRLVRIRGELMGRAGKARPGTMAAIIGLDFDTVREVCDSVTGTVVPANINAPGQIVISGDVSAVAAACGAAEAAGARRAMRLNVSGAFHSPLVKEAREGLAEALESLEFNDPAFAVVANATGVPVVSGVTARELLIAQLTSPVRWVECIEAMRDTGPDLWLELGPGKVLSGLMRRIDRTQRVRAIGDPDGLEAFTEELGDA